MAPTVKTQLSVLTQKIRNLNLERMVWAMGKFWRRIWIQHPKIRQKQIFSSWDKIFFDQSNWRKPLHSHIISKLLISVAFPIQTTPETHASSAQWVTGVSREWCGRNVVLTTHPLLTSRLIMRYSTNNQCLLGMLLFPLFYFVLVFKVHMKHTGILQA